MCSHSLKIKTKRSASIIFKMATNCALYWNFI